MKPNMTVVAYTKPGGSVLMREETEIAVNFGADELVSMVTLSSRSGLGLQSSIETLRFKELWSTSIDFDAFNELKAAKFNYKLYPSRNGVVIQPSK